MQCSNLLRLLQEQEIRCKVDDSSFENRSSLSVRELRHLRHPLRPLPVQIDRVRLVLRLFLLPSRILHHRSLHRKLPSRNLSRDRAGEPRNLREDGIRRLVQFHNLRSTRGNGLVSFRHEKGAELSNLTGEVRSKRSSREPRLASSVRAAILLSELMIRNRSGSGRVEVG